MLRTATISPYFWSLGDGCPFRPCLDPPLKLRQTTGSAGEWSEGREVNAWNSHVRCSCSQPSVQKVRYWQSCSWFGCRTVECFMYRNWHGRQ